LQEEKNNMSERVARLERKMKKGEEEKQNNLLITG
jgi:hypothetical protein